MSDFIDTYKKSIQQFNTLPGFENIFKMREGCNGSSLILEMNPKQGDGQIEVLSPLPEVSMSLIDVTSKTSYTTLMGSVDASKGDHLTIRFSLSGGFQYFKNKQRFRNSQQASCLMFYFPEGETLDFHQPEGVHNHGVTFHTPASNFFSVFGDDADYGETFSRIRQGKLDSIYFDQPPMTPAMIQITRELLACSYQGNMRKLFLEGAGIQLLTRFVEHMGGQSSAPTLLAHKLDELKSVEGDWLENIRFILERSYTSPPSREQLCQLVGKNKNKLSQGFKMQYGLSISQYTKKLRMEQGMHLLKNSNKTVSVIANEMGYEHASSFINAFINQYGVSPSEIRTSQM